MQSIMQKHLAGLSDLAVFIYPPRTGVVSSGFEHDDTTSSENTRSEKAVAASL